MTLPTQDSSYNISFEGKFIKISFPGNEVNNIVYRSEKITILKINTTQFVITDGSSLKLTYTNDSGNTSGNIADYISNLITRIREQEVIVNTGADISGDDIATLTAVNKFGRNPEVDINTTPEDIWNGGGNYTGQPVGFTPETVQVFSSSALDTAAGTGARTIRFHGLATSTSTSYTSQDVTLNGTTPVTTVSTWYRINRAYVLTAGTTGANQGTITIRASATIANVFVVMPVLLNQTAVLAYTVPFGKEGFINSFRTQIARLSGAAGSAVVTLRVRDTLNGGTFRAFRVLDAQSGAIVQEDYSFPLQISQGSDVKVRIESVSDNDTTASGSFSILLRDL